MLKFTETTPFLVHLGKIPQPSRLEGVVLVKLSSFHGWMRGEVGEYEFLSDLKKIVLVLGQVRSFRCSMTRGQPRNNTVVLLDGNVWIAIYSDIERFECNKFD